MMNLLLMRGIPSQQARESSFVAIARCMGMEMNDVGNYIKSFIPRREKELCNLMQGKQEGTKRAHINPKETFKENLMQKRTHKPRRGEDWVDYL